MATRTVEATGAGRGASGATEAGTPEATDAGNGSPGATEAGTPEATEAGESSEEEYLPPCRAAALYVVPCPLCGREVRLKTLRYTHKCGRNFNTSARAQEQHKLAEAAILARMGCKAAKAQRMEQPLERHVEVTAHREEEKQRKYNKMLNF